jgi:ferrous-iron efflux pump FieF
VHPPASTGNDEERLLRRATVPAVLVAALLVTTKLAAFLVTQSVSVLASLLDSLMDVGASFINLLAVRYSLQPPDAQHRFGHGKAEPIAGLAQAMFITGSGLFLVLEAIERLLNPRPIEQVGIGLAVMLFSIVATVLLVLFQRYVVRRTRSTAILADSLHYKSDILSNSGIILALLLSQYGWPGIDPLFALCIAAYVLFCAWGIARLAFDELLDRELPEEQRQQIIQLASSHAEVRGQHDLRTRMSGRIAHIQLHLELDDALPLLEAHRIGDEVEAAIRKAIPGADVVIHHDPAGVADAKQAELP